MSDARESNTSIADAATVNGLLRCWVRETGITVPEHGTLTIDLPAHATRVEADVDYRSPAGFHRFERARMPTGTPVTAASLAALLASEATAGQACAADLVADLVARVADSHCRVSSFLEARRTDSTAGDERPVEQPFLEAEQALLLGHPLHPAPKSRIGLSPSEAAGFSPELRGRFQVHWFAAHPSVLQEAGQAHELLEPALPEAPAGTVPVPAHPWQARELRSREAIRELLAGGLLHDLGPSGAPWYPTASLRTVYRPDIPVMLKLSLGLPITNSKREHLRAELHRGTEIDRLLDAGLGSELASAYPAFGIVRDPAWRAVEASRTAPGVESGLEVVVRANPFAAGSCGDDAVCVAGLLAERPDTGRSGIARVIDHLCARTGRSRQDVAEQWCARYFDAVIAPVLWLYRTFGLGLEAHQQNTLVSLNGSGWPRGGWYRDNQGYYIGASCVERLERFVPGIGLAGGNRCAESVIDERLGYYIGINNLVGLAGALGSQGIAEEQGVLALLRERLRAYADLAMVRQLTEAPTVRCKANLLTRADGLDELVGPLETQSVYREIANPFMGGA